VPHPHETPPPSPATSHDTRHGHPVWMPRGGHAALWFWGGLCVILAAALLYLYKGYTTQERQGRFLLDQQQLLTSENQKLSSQVDKLQTELSQTGSLLRNREEILRATKESLETVKAQNDQEIATGEAARKAREDLQAAIEKAADLSGADGFRVFAEGDRVIVRLSHGLLFDVNEVTLADKGAALLKKIAPALKAAPAPEIDVDGHTEAAPPAGPTAKAAASNWDLSARRAAAVVRALGDDGVPAACLTLRAFAGNHPIAPNDGAERVKNRRIEIILKPSVPAQPPAPAPAAAPAPAP